jgi:hypothetical protein
MWMFCISSPQKKAYVVAVGVSSITMEIPAAVDSIRALEWLVR